MSFVDWMKRHCYMCRSHKRENARRVQTALDKIERLDEAADRMEKQFPARTLAEALEQLAGKGGSG